MLKHFISNVFKWYNIKLFYNIPNNLDAALGPDGDISTQIIKFLHKTKLYKKIKKKNLVK